MIKTTRKSHNKAVILSLGYVLLYLHIVLEVISLLRVAHSDIQNLMHEADNREMELLVATQAYTRTITLLIWIPSVIAGLMAYSDCIYRSLFLPKSVFNVPAVRRGEEHPILLFQLFPFGELCDNFVVGYLGPWYALGLGITTIPLWHTFITCLIKYVNLKLQILNKRVEEMDVIIISKFVYSKIKYINILVWADYPT